LIERIDKDKYCHQINFKAFESILKKCKFITNIDIRSAANSEHVLLSVANNCKYLKSMSYHFDDISEKTLTTFGKKCGQQLREITNKYCRYKFEYDQKFKNMLESCPKLCSLNGLKLETFVDSNRLIVPKVSRIKGQRVFGEIDLDLIKVLTDNCMNSLKVLQISDINLEYVDQRNCLMKLISRLVGLEEFNLELDHESYEPFVNNMDIIGSNCNKINKLEIHIDQMHWIQAPHNSLLFDRIGFFTQIKFLKISVWYFSDTISFDSLKSCKLLTHLSLYHSAVNDQLLKDINLFLPQLTHLDIRSDGYITEKTMDLLPKLNQLEVIKIGPHQNNMSWFKYVKGKVILNSINSCPKLKSIELKGSDITYKTIDALIDLALKKPKMYFSHSFRWIIKKKTDKFYMKYQSFSDFPKNLSIFINQSNDWLKDYFR
jgi:hypothetical protein